MLIIASRSNAQTINAEQIKKDNVTIKGNTLHQLRADTSYIATRHYVDSLMGGGSSDTLKLDSIKRHPGTDSVFYYTNGIEKFAFIDSVSASTISASAWSLTGNSGTSASTNFLGTIDSVPLIERSFNRSHFRLNTNGSLSLGASKKRTAYGIGFAIEAAAENVFVGDSCGWQISYGNGADYDTSTSNNCVGIGSHALFSLKKGWNITAVGAFAGYSDTGAFAHGNPFIGSSGNECTYVGAFAGYNNIAEENTFVGDYAGFSNTLGGINAFFGLNAGAKNTTGSDNTYLGTSCFPNIIDGRDNVGIGYHASEAQTGGSNNVIIGVQAGQNNTLTNYSTIIGNQTAANLTGNHNTCVGAFAGYNAGIGNVCIGESAGKNWTGDHAFFLDANFLTRADLNADTTEAAFFVKDLNLTSTRSGRYNGFLSIFNSTVKAGSYLFCNDANGYSQWSSVAIDTTAKDAVTQNAVEGIIRKDQTGTTYTVTNSFVAVGTNIILTLATTGVTTGNQISVLPQTGSFVITFETAGVAAAPNKDTTIHWRIGN